MSKKAPLILVLAILVGVIMVITILFLSDSNDLTYQEAPETSPTEELEQVVADNVGKRIGVMPPPVELDFDTGTYVPIEELVPFVEGQQIGDFVYNGFEELSSRNAYVLSFTGTTTLTGAIQGIVNNGVVFGNYHLGYGFSPDEQSQQKLPTIDIPADTSAEVIVSEKGLQFPGLQLQPDARSHFRSVLGFPDCSGGKDYPVCLRSADGQLLPDSPSYKYFEEGIEIEITEYKLYVCTGWCDGVTEEITHSFRNTSGEINTEYFKTQLSVIGEIAYRERGDWYFWEIDSPATRQEVVFADIESAYSSNAVPFYSLVAETEDFLALSVNCFKESDCGDNGLYKVEKSTNDFIQMKEGERYSSMWTAPTVSPDEEKIVVVSLDGLEIGVIDLLTDTYRELFLLDADREQSYLSLGMGNDGSYNWIDDRTFDVAIYAENGAGAVLQNQRLIIPD